jgi:hypothetical protein
MMMMLMVVMPWKLFFRKIVESLGAQGFFYLGLVFPLTIFVTIASSVATVVGGNSLFCKDR